MIFSPDLIAYLVATFVLAITPGNDVLFITSQSIGNGIRGGIAATLGISFGLLFHLAALTFGLSEILILYPWVLQVIKILGVLYLLFLAFKAFKSSRTSFNAEMQPVASSRKIFFRGALTNLTNPKVALFFLAFIPQFVDPLKGKIANQVLLLGFLFLNIGTCTNLVYAILFGSASQKIKNNKRFNRILGKLTGIIFVGLALKLLADKS